MKITRILLSNKELQRFLLVGSLSTLTHFCIMHALYSYVNLSIILSTLFGFIGSLIVSYTLNKNYTFKSDKKISTSLTLYLFVTLFGLALNVSIMHLGVKIFEINHLIVFLVVTIIVATNNYLLSKKIVF